VLYWAIFALGLNVLVGYGGLVSLGHAGLFAIAGYTAGLMLEAGHGHVAADLTALAVILATSAVYAALALRATGIGFLMITLALGQIVWGIAYRWADLTHGDNGVKVASVPAPFGIDLSRPEAFYYMTLVVFFLAVASMAVFVRSPFGASLAGTRDQARRMSALGFNVWLIRFLAFLFSGFWTGVAGLLYLYHKQFISPRSPHCRPRRGAADGDLGGIATLLGPSSALRLS
jgi:branched-chain amino acid transport system permease protein